MEVTNSQLPLEFRNIDKIYLLDFNSSHINFKASLPHNCLLILYKIDYYYLDLGIAGINTNR